MLSITRASLIATTLLAAVALQPVALLAEEAAQPAPAAAQKKSGCQMAGCADCANGDSCCPECQAAAEKAGKVAAADCPCKHAKRSSKKAKRKAARAAQSKPQQ